MYVYDEANNLAKAIQESREYKEFKKAKEEVANNPEMKAKIDDFEKNRWDECSRGIHFFITREEAVRY